jgi:hypothetical protein
VYVHNTHTAIERKRIIKAFRTCGAVAPEHAKSLRQLGLEDKRFLRRMHDQGIVREVRPGEFYLDEDALSEYQSTLIKWLAVPLALVLILMIYLIVRQP